MQLVKRKGRVKLIIVRRWLAVGVESLGNVAVFFAGFFAILSRDSLDAGTVALSISCALQITQTLNWFVRMAAEVETSSVSIERIKEFSEISQVSLLYQFLELDFGIHFTSNDRKQHWRLLKTSDQGLVGLKKGRLHLIRTKVGTEMDWD